jgi:predicted  nucleic acid-binding Zn-ribbon protein
MSENAEVKPEAKGAPAPSANSRAALDQLARIEDKMARIEEKFARQEGQIARAQDSLDRAATRVEAAARSVDAAELATEVGKLRATVEKVPRLGGLVIAGLITAASTAILFILILKFFPGLLK